MRLLFVISLLVLTSCSPKFQVGDCVHWGSNERWQSDGEYVEKILEVGKRKYRTASVGKFSGQAIEGSDYFTTLDRISNKVECPQVLKDYTGEVK